MGRLIGSKCRQCRRSGERLFIKGDRCVSPKCAMVKKPYAPGAHGKTGSKGKGQSEYGKQLAMKQKIKRVYGVMEKQFRRHFEDARKKQGITGDNLIARLEMRMDNVIYRTGFASSRTLSRQLVNHRSFLVNGKKMDIPSYELKIGDTISISSVKKDKNYFKSIIPFIKNKKDTPSWIQFDAEKMEGKVLAIPQRSDVGIGINAQMVVEYYSR